MPAYCKQLISGLDAISFRNIDYAVMGCVFDSQNTIGCLADERVYQSDLVQRIQSRGLSAKAEVLITLEHKSFVKQLYLDLLVDDCAIYELKVVSELNSNHISQLLTYLYLLDLPHGKLVNFRTRSVEHQFVNAPVPRSNRVGFSVNDSEFTGEPRFRDIVVDLIRDWGTCLSTSLYHDAILKLVTGKDMGVLVPLTIGQKRISSQRFFLIDADSSVEVTTFKTHDFNYQSQLQKLLKISPLKTIHWVNIGTHCVTFNSVQSTTNQTSASTC
ncbi:MAG: GxxExxY protein [Planctomycetota bacterium]